MMTKAAIPCANIHCNNSAIYIDGVCSSCSSWKQTHGYERPLRMCKWPGRGHNLLSTSELASLIGLSIRQIDYAVRTNKITPTISSDGSGSSRGWDIEAALEAYMKLLIPYESENERTLPLGVTFNINKQEIWDHLSAKWPMGRDMYIDQRMDP